MPYSCLQFKLCADECKIRTGHCQCTVERQVRKFFNCYFWFLCNLFIPNALACSNETSLLLLFFHFKYQISWKAIKGSWRVACCMNLDLSWSIVLQSAIVTSSVSLRRRRNVWRIYLHAWSSPNFFLYLFQMPQQMLWTTLWSCIGTKKFFSIYVWGSKFVKYRGVIFVNYCSTKSLVTACSICTCVKFVLCTDTFKIKVSCIFF